MRKDCLSTSWLFGMFSTSIREVNETSCKDGSLKMEDEEKAYFFKCSMLILLVPLKNINKYLGLDQQMQSTKRKQVFK